MNHSPRRLLPSVAGTLVRVSPPQTKPFGRWASPQRASASPPSGLGEESATVEVGPLKVTGRGTRTAPLVAIGGLLLAGWGLGALLAK